MESKQIKFGAILSYIQIFVAIAVSLVYTPILVRELGQNEYGLYNTVTSVVTLIELLKLGFNHSYIRYYSKYQSDKDNDNINKLNGLFILVFSALGVVALFCGLLLSQEIELVFNYKMVSDEINIAKNLLIISTFNLAFSFPSTVFSTIVLAQERFVFIKILTIVQTIAVPLATLPFLLLGYGSISVVAVIFAVSVIISVITAFYVFFVLHSKFVFKDFEKGLFKSMMQYTAFIAVNSIVDYLNWSVDKFLLGRYCSFTSVAVYSVGYTVYSLYMNLSTAASNVFVPHIHKIVNELKANALEMNKALTNIFIKIGRIQFFVLGLFLTGLIFFGKPFIVLWVGSEYKNAYYVMLLFIISAFVPLIQNIGIEIQRALNKHQFRSLLYLFMALTNLVISYFLCRRYGEIGAAFGTAFSLVVANGIAMNIYYHKHCGLSVLSFFGSILRMCKGVILPVIYGVVISVVFEINTFLSLILHAVLFTSIYIASMWLLALNDEEKNGVRKFIVNVVGRGYDKNNR